MFRYELEVGFHDDISDRIDEGVYYGFIEKHEASGMSHNRTYTSTLCFFSESKLDRKVLEVELKDIRIFNIDEKKVA